MDILFSEEQITFIRKRFDVPVKSTDSDNTIRWKAAQREVVQDLIYINEQTRKHSNAGGSMEFNLRPRE